MKCLFTFHISLILILTAATTQAQTITTITGNGVDGFTGDGGMASAALISGPTGIAFDANGNMYFADQTNNSIRKINAAGIITTIAGTELTGYNGDNIPASVAKLNLPWGIAVDNTGNVYVADQLNFRIRKIDTSGTITTIAGTGSNGNTGDGGPATAADFGFTMGIALNNSGDIYVTDQTHHVVRKINSAGIVTKIAGTGATGNAGDGGPATAATLGDLFGIALDASGNVYLPNADHHCIRKINSAGIISTIAGTGTSGYSGDGGPATAAHLNYPVNVSTDTSGNLYISEAIGKRVRVIDNSGIIKTIAGTGITGFSGDGGPATSAKISGPCDARVGPNRILYIADFDNKRIREVVPYNLRATNTSNEREAIKIFPNPGNGNVFVSTPFNIGETIHIVVNSLEGKKITEMASTENFFALHMDAPPGNYVVSWYMGQETGSIILTVK